MDVTNLTFGIKDVVAIIAGVTSGVSFVFAIKHSDEKNKAGLLTTEKKLQEHTTTNKEALAIFKAEVEERFMHARNSKKANIMRIYEDLTKIDESFQEEVKEIKSEQKTAHEKMSTKLDILSSQMSSMNSSLAELTGYIRARKEGK